MLERWQKQHRRSRWLTVVAFTSLIALSFWLACTAGPLWFGFALFFLAALIFTTVGAWRGCARVTRMLSELRAGLDEPGRRSGPEQGNSGEAAPNTFLKLGEALIVGPVVPSNGEGVATFVALHLEAEIAARSVVRDRPTKSYGQSLFAGAHRAAEESVSDSRSRLHAARASARRGPMS